MHESPMFGAMPPFEKPKTNNWREQVHKDAELVLADAGQGQRLREEDFIDENKEGYARKDVERDLETMKRIKEKFSENDDELPDEVIRKIKEGKLRSEALEIVIMGGGQKMKWFLEGARLVRTAETDDILGGVDGVLELPMEGESPQRIALAIDASMNPDFSSVERKITRGIAKMNEGKMKVKYFQSQIDDFKGKLTTIIPITLGLEGKNSEKLIHLFADIRRAHDGDSSVDLTRRSAEAENHPAQIIFLKEMLVQLEMYARIFTREGSFTKHAIGKITAAVKEILEQKYYINSEELEDDGVYGAIKEVARRQAAMHGK